MMEKYAQCSVFFYGAEGSNPVCTEFTPILSSRELQDFFPGHDYRRTYYPIVWDPSLPYWQLANERTIQGIKANLKPHDVICLIAGLCHKPIADALADQPVLCVEYGIGYYGTFAPFKVFESYAHMHHCYGRDSRDPDGKWFDAVIPNYFDVQDFTFRPWARQDKPYALFMGRMIRRKGLQVAIEACHRAGLQLLLSGQGVIKATPETITTEEGDYPALGAKFVGYSDVQRRNELMGNAACLIAPTFYLEPFGGVAVEAQLTGCPAITSDWGAFNDTVEHGVTGYRCRTLEQFAWAIKNAHRLNRAVIRARAESLYSLERVSQMYLEYFRMLATLWGDGFYADNPQRRNLNWLMR